MRKIVYTVAVLLYLPLCAYLLLPNPEFPKPPAGAVLSQEPADTETPLRRAYFTNYSREEVIQHYKQQLDGLPLLRLNYPPEEAQVIIRDQTRSYYLEELTQPFRYSFFINGFIAQQEKDAIIINGEEYYQKLTVRAIPSNPFIRTALISVGYIVFLLTILEWQRLCREIQKMFRS